MGIHLLHHPPSLWQCFKPPLSSKLLRNTLCLRPSCGTKMAIRCATADRSCEPSPDEDEDPISAQSRRHREKMDRREKELRAELRASRGGSHEYSQDDKVAELEDTLFRDEGDKVQSYMRDIASNKCILYKKGREMALMISLKVLVAMRLSAMITANAYLRVDGSSSEISFHTVEQIIRTYVSTFLKFLEDTWHGKVDQADFETRLLSVLGALNGLAAVSHIMFEDALAAANATEELSSHYNPKCDVEALNGEVQRKMKQLERDFMAASKDSEDKVYELLPRTLDDATEHLLVFVTQMTRLRKKAIAHAQARANDTTNGGGSTKEMDPR